MPDKKAKGIQLPSLSEVKDGVLEFLWERERIDEDDLPFRASARIVKLILPLYAILKVIVFIAVSAQFPHALQSTVVLCITAVLSISLGIAGLHYRASMLCFLFCGVNTLVVGAETAVLLRIAASLPSGSLRSSLAFYVSISILDAIAVIVVAITFFRLRQKEKKEEAEEEEKKKEREEREEKIRKQKRHEMREARQREIEAQRRAQAEEDSAAAAGAVPASHPPPRVGSLGSGARV